MPPAQSRFKKMVQLIQDIFSLRICVKKKAPSVKNTDEKILRTFKELTVGISEVFQDGENSFNEFLRCDKIACKISVLSEQIGQVRILHLMWQNGYDLDLEELTSRCRSLNLLIDCLRDDVFHAYLRLPPDHKLALLKKSKQVSAIFAVLGALESQVTTLMKTMVPYGRMAQSLKPLLYPRVNPVVYKKTTKNVYNYHMPNCCPPTYYSTNLKNGKRRTVESGTDPVRELEYQNVNETLKKSVGIQPSKTVICSCKYFRDNNPLVRYCSGNNFKIGSAPCARPSSEFSTEELIRQSCSSSRNSNIFPSRSFSSISMLLDGKVSFKKSNSQINLWKVAAELIADHPNYK